jgi:hypothetical protein
MHLMQSFYWSTLSKPSCKTVFIGANKSMLLHVIKVIICYFDQIEPDLLVPNNYFIHCMYLVQRFSNWGLRPFLGLPNIF